MRVAVLGGGGFRVPLIYAALVEARLPIDEVVLEDVSAERLAVISSVLRGGAVPVTTTSSLDAAIEGTDLIFSAVRVGGLDGRIEDERSALGLGLIGQETVGSGGLRYALRSVPTALDTARVIADRAPGAWTVTMTNPAGVVTEVMAGVLGDRVIGVCDSPTALARRACAALGVDPGPSLASVSGRVEIDYLGLNHLGWLRALRIDGIDRLPQLLDSEAALGDIEEARLFGADVVRALGALPNEYLYWYYGEREALAGVLAAGRTRGEHVRREQRSFYAAAAAEPAAAASLWRAANDERNRSYFAELREDERDEGDLAVGGYETIAAAVATALTGGPPARLIVDVPNRGAVGFLPDDAVVELPCLVDSSGARPLPVAPATLHQQGLMSLVKSCERDIVAAALTGDREAALRAFALHPLVGSLEAARRLSDGR